MNWVKLAERTPPRCELVLLRYEDEHQVRYTVAWYDSGLWWLDASRTLNRHFDNVTHWTQIYPPGDVLVDEADQQERDALQVLISENGPDTMNTRPYDYELRDRRLQQMKLRELLYSAVTLFECDDECSDPSTAVWGWLQDARTALEGAAAE